MWAGSLNSAPHPVTRRYSFLQDVVLGSTREWPTLSRLWRPVSQCRSLLLCPLQRAAVELTTALCLGWAFPALSLICGVLQVLGAIFFLLTSSHPWPVLHWQQVSPVLGCPFHSCSGSGRGMTAPLHRAPRMDPSAV